jgi:PAS domain S-box-containing protein
MSEERYRDRISNLEAESLLRSKRQLTEILESIRDGFMALDFDWRFTFANQKAAQTAHMDLADLLGKSIWETWPQLRGTPLEACYRKAMIERQADQLEVQGLVSGKWYNVRAYPSLEGISVFFVDITERKLAEQALKRNERQLRIVLENLPVGVRFFDSSGKIAYRNPAAEKIWNVGEAAGEDGAPAQRGWRLESGEPIAPEEWAAARAVARGETVLNELIEIEASDGDHKILRHSGIPILDEDGKKMGAITVTEDITELKRTEEKLLQLNEELENRIRARTLQLAAAKDRIETLADLSHVLAEVETDRQKVLNTVASRVAELVGDTCTIALLTEDEQYLQAVAYYHPNPRAMALLHEMTKIRLPADEGALGEVLETGQPVLIANIQPEVYRSMAAPGYLPYLEEFGIHDILIVPLRARGKTTGTLAVSRDEPGRTYTRADQTFLQELADHAALVIVNAQLFADLEEQLAARKRIEAENLELQRLLLDSAENERSRIARELHDGPMQDLYGLIYQMNDPEQLNAPDISKIREDLSQINATLRTISMNLRPPTLFQLGIKSSIKEHLSRLQQAKPDLAIHFDWASKERELPEAVHLALYRIYQVAITNALRHAEASEVNVRFRQNEDSLVLEVEDNGLGFEVPLRWIDSARRGHLGIVGAIERAEAIGGRLEVQSSPGQGTCFRVIVPLNRPVDEPDA